MRELKFEAWDASEKQMLCWGQLIHDPDCWIIALLLNEADDGDAIRQFTGLQDKNNTDIYEGDLLKNASGRVYCVVWHSFTGCWDAEVKAAAGSAMCFANAASFIRDVVIGNVYENPELLEQS